MISKNKLSDEKSPYLLAHANNPVDWYPWGEEAFSEAKKRDVPIFLSIGYSSCHWCHVMEKESFENQSVAELLNKNFVSIKIDREERPDIDNIYMEACLAFNGSGGWPLSVFINHDKIPFFAGTYYPKRGFINLLERVNNAWKSNRDSLIETGEKIREYIKDKRASGGREGDFSIEKVYQKIARNFDPVYGGFFDAPKFPTPQILLFLLRYNTLYSNSYSGNIIRKTLDCMAQGGIFDQIGGGFFRYSTDRKWLVPHFEKMLYDNAMLLMVYSEASRSLDSRFGSIAERIAEYLFRVMHDKNGGFYTAQDADSEGIEGKYYLFTPDEIFYLYGMDEGEKFSEDYDITHKGNFEGKNIPNRIGKDFIINDRRIPEILFYRNRRIPPFLDDKITTSSNALIIAALSVAGRLLCIPKYIREAVRCANFIDNNLFVDGRLMARWREEEAKHPSTLDDYAYLLWGYMELYYSTNDSKWLKKSMELSSEIIKLFGDTSGAMFYTGSDVNDLPVRQKVIRDGAIPSGNSIISYNFLRLYEITHREELMKAAERIIDDVYKNMIEEPYGYASHLISYMYRENGKSISVVDGEGMDEMLKVTEGFRPFVNLSVINPKEQEIAEMIADMKGKHNIGGKATAYICDKNGCHPPVTNPKEFSEMI